MAETNPNNTFVGTYKAKLDDKDRINVPSDFINIIKRINPQYNYSHDIFASLSKVEGENLESTINCVKFMPSHYFARDILKPLKDQDHYFGNIEKLKFGSQNRIRLPKDFKESLNIKKEAIFTGMNNSFYLWSLNGWVNYRNKEGPKPMKLSNISFEE